MNEIHKAKVSHKGDDIHCAEWEGDPYMYSFQTRNSRDGGAWWTAVYGVAQSWTLLKQLSSSSSNIIQSFSTSVSSFIYWQNKNYNFAIVALKLHLYCLQNFKIFFNIYLFNKLCIFIITIIQNCWYCYKHNFMPNWNLHSQGQSKLIYIYFLFLLLGYKLMDGKNRVSLLN